MRFFTHLACFAVHRSNDGMLLALQVVAGPSLVAADLLVAAANSRKPSTMWEYMTGWLESDLKNPECVTKVLPGVAASDYVPALERMLDAAARVGVQVKPDDLLVVMARHGAENCWQHAVSRLKWKPSADVINTLVDAAIEGGHHGILYHLEQNAGLPYEYRMRLHWKRKLDDAVRGKNLQYIHKVLAASEWLKASDLIEVERFALRTGNQHLKKSVIDPIMDLSLGRWNLLLNASKRPDNVVLLPLKQAA